METNISRKYTCDVRKWKSGKNERGKRSQTGIKGRNRKESGGKKKRRTSNTTPTTTTNLFEIAAVAAASVSRVLLLLAWQFEHPPSGVFALLNGAWQLLEELGRY